MAFCPPLEFGHSSPAGNEKLPAALMRFISLQRINERSPPTRVCLSRYVPLSGFLNLSAGYSSIRPEVLFHTSNAPGIRLPELSPLRQLIVSSTMISLLALPPLNYQQAARRACCPQSIRRTTTSNGKIASRVLIRPRVRSHPRLVLPKHEGRYSLRLFAFQGISLARTNVSEEKFPLSYLPFLLPGQDAVQSIGNLRTRISPEREIQPS